MYCNAILLATLAVASTVNALATPVHGVRHLHNRHSSIAKARAPAPAPEPAGAAIASPFVSKRGMKKRCKPRVPPSSLTSSAPASASSSAAVLPSGVGNVGADPNSPTAAPAEPSTKAPAPAPSSSSAAPPPPPPPPPKPTTSAAPPPPKPTTSAAPPPPPAPTSGGGSGGGNCDDLFATGCTRTGQGTFYNTGLTSCGIQNSDSDFIAAVSEKLYDQFEVDGNPNHDKLCGRKAQVTFQGKTITVTITDRCTACDTFDLDFTPTAFQALGIDLGVGRVSGVQWKFIS